MRRQRVVAREEHGHPCTDSAVRLTDAQLPAPPQRVEFRGVARRLRSPCRDAYRPRPALATSARYSSSTCFSMATSDSNDSGGSGPNEKRKNDA